MKGIILGTKRGCLGSLLCLVVSCGVVPLTLAAESSEATPSDNVDTAPNNPSLSVLNDFEGLLLSSRIIGGRDAQADSWPSLVALVNPGPSSVMNRFFCGATVVAERWVMTAAHCLFGSVGQPILPSSIRVIAGIRNLENDVPEEEVVVTNIVIHPLYNNTESIPPFDIALLELGSVINAPVTNLFADDPADYNGEDSFIAGWGATRFVVEDRSDGSPQGRAEGFPAQLQEAVVPIVPLDRCNSIVSYQGAITHRQVCAGLIDGGVDACAGDSGGPLFVVQDGSIKQLGITSFGNGCALANFYGIYTSVSHLLPWLSEFIDVPFQTAELAARLDAGLPAPDPVDPESNESKGTLFGAVHPLLVFFLLFSWLCRRPSFR